MRESALVVVKSHGCSTKISIDLRLFDSNGETNFSILGRVVREAVESNRKCSKGGGKRSDNKNTTKEER